jgi:hypothetical protein
LLRSFLSPELVPILEFWMALLSVQFINQIISRWARTVTPGEAAATPPTAECYRIRNLVTLLTDVRNWIVTFAGGPERTGIGLTDVGAGDLAVVNRYRPDAGVGGFSLGRSANCREEHPAMAIQTAAMRTRPCTRNNHITKSLTKRMRACHNPRGHLRSM